MPHLGAAMERSLHERSLKDAFVSLVARSAVAGLSKRQSFGDIQSGISDAQTAFSSWDNCMKVNYCKWPVIALIIVGGLILLSIVWCIVRCACCGLSCCCECFYCLKCCGNCCGCCDPPRGKRSKYLDDPFIPPNHDQAYQPNAPMDMGRPPKADVPQYAVFESGDKKDADSLPAMPVWDDSSSKKVLVEEDSVEMEPLKKMEQQNLSAMNVTNASQPTIPSPLSPAGSRSPYGPPNGQRGPQGYMSAKQAAVDPYGATGQGYSDFDNGYGNNAYAQASQTNMNQGYGAAGAVAVGAVGRRTPHQDYNNGYGQNESYGQNEGYGRNVGGQGYPQSRSPRPPNDVYGRSGTPGPYNNGSYQGPSRNNSYNTPGRMISPAPQAAYGYGNASRTQSPGPQAGYGHPQRSQTQTPNSYNRQYPPAPSRQYSSESSRPILRPAPERQSSEQPSPVSPIQNTGGFDFNSGFARADSRRDNVSPAPATAAYPVYRSYKPQQGGQQTNNWDGY